MDSKESSGGHATLQQRQLGKNRGGVAVVDCMCRSDRQIRKRQESINP